MEFNILNIAAYLGIIVFAINGVMNAALKQFDLIGIYIFTLLSVIGGGVIRDVIVGRIPAVIVEPLPIYLTLITITFSLLFKIYRYPKIEQHYLFIIIDSMGLVAFSIIGSIVGVESQLNIVGITLMALITGIGGGIIRDLIIGEIPIIFRSYEYYSIFSIVTGIVIGYLKHFDQLTNQNILIAAIIILLLRIICYFQRWQMIKY